jgi:hypothetical protein
MVVEIRCAADNTPHLGYVWLSAFPREGTVMDFMEYKFSVVGIELPHLTMCDDIPTALQTGVREHAERTPIIWVVGRRTNKKQTCPNGHPADGAPCVIYKCEKLL